VHGANVTVAKRVIDIVEVVANAIERESTDGEINLSLIVATEFCFANQAVAISIIP
jgi:hypothetical protein